MSAHPQQVVITGMGLVTCLGTSAEATWQGVLGRRCGLGPMSAMESPLPAGREGGQAPDLPSDFMPGAAREARYLRWAMDQALCGAGLGASFPYAPGRCGMVIGTTLHGIRRGGDYLRTGDLGFLLGFPSASVLVAAANGLPIGGPALTNCSACSSGQGSIGLGMLLLRAHQVDMVIAGGYDPVSEYVYGGFDSLRLVSEGKTRPFCRARDGMNIAEGYAVVVLEREQDAQRRGAGVAAYVRGHGESSDAHHLTQPHPQGEGAARAVSIALRNAGIEAAEIDLVSAHATGTPGNDAAEYQAFRHSLGEGVSTKATVAFKSHVGHTLGAAGATEVILSAMALRDQVVPPTANVSAADLEFDVGLNTGPPSAAPLRATLNTSLGFGGANSCIVLSPSGRSAEGAATEPREVLITGVGVVAAGCIGNEAFLRRLGESARAPVVADAGGVTDSELTHLLNARRVRRMSEYVKLTLAATAEACRHAGIVDVQQFSADAAAILGTMHGSVAFSETYYQQIVGEGISAANPALFAEGVPSVGAAHLSMMLGVKGPCQAIIGSRTAGLDALWLAAQRIAAGEWERAFVGAGEEYSPLVNAAYEHAGVRAPSGSNRRGFATGSGAVTLVLESRASVQGRSGRVYGTVQGGAARCSQGLDGRGGAEAVRGVWKAIGSPRHLIGSGNGTWIDLVERRGLGLIRGGQEPFVSSMYGHIPELFSAGALAAIAAVVLSGRLPASIGLRRSDRGQAATGTGTVTSVGVLCCDYAGPVSAVRVKLAPVGPPA